MLRLAIVVAAPLQYEGLNLGLGEFADSLQYKMRVRNFEVSTFRHLLHKRK
jgi:hypothetical protein